MTHSAMLGSNNPYASHNHFAQPSTDTNPFSDMQATNQQRPTSSSKSVQLRRLDGSPYEVNAKAKKIEVARDMYDGQNPPEYKRQNSGPYVAQPQPTTTVSPSEHRDSCGRCSGPGAVAGDVGQVARPRHECNKCGKQKASNAPLTQSDVVPGQPRPVTAEAIWSFPASNLEDVRPNTSAERPRRKCNKCGKAKRPVTASAAAATIEMSTPDRDSLPPSSRHIASQHIMYGGTRPATLQLSCDIPQRKPVPAQNRPSSVDSIDIGVIPPTATSERPQPNVLTEENVEGSPLLNSSIGQQRNQPRRSTSVSSISSTLSRTFSKQRKLSRDSQAADDGDLGAGRLINLISSAIRGNDTQNYSKIRAQDKVDERPGSPFSFVGTSAGDDGFELGDMGKSQSGHDSAWEKVDRSGVSMHASDQKHAEHATISIHRSTTPPNYQDDVFLGSPGQHPGITRFKSLRDGVSRASSVARSTSLRRLNSLKNAPQYWYRTDMAIEGVESSPAGVY